MVLVVDEYHLEILRDHDLVGRWYLADVEVRRDIAERFVLFLGDEEMEFLADDALQFAYDGVTAMQNAWLRAQKKKRKHRKAAADAARRKDETPAPAAKGEQPVSEPVRATRQTRPAASSELARRLAASTAAAPAAKSSQPERISQPAKSEPPVAAEQVGSSRQTLAARRRKIAAEAVDAPPAPVASPRSTRRRREPLVEPAPVSAQAEEPSAAPPVAASGGPGALPPVELGGGPGALPPPWIAPGHSEDEVAITSPQTVPSPFIPDELRVPAGVPSPSSGLDDARARRRSRVAVPPPSPEPIRPRDRARRLTTDSNGASSPIVEEAPAQSVPEEEPASADVRFAAEGHHPAETNTGLLSRLRRQPKKPDNHVHKFQESGSSVGLVRRVCVECSYVSIGSDDDSSSLTRW